MLPFNPSDVLDDALVPRAYAEAWQDIEATLQRTEPEHQSWEDAIKESRSRS